MCPRHLSVTPLDSLPLLSLLIFFSLPFVPLLAIPSTGADDLTSARCQSKCLLELERRHRNNSESRRLLRHQISTLCKEDRECASCILPCRELLLDGAECQRAVCKGSDAPGDCAQSCAFVAQILQQKPGQCPGQEDRPRGPDSECSAFCDADADCPEVDKCCAVGCSRTCLGPALNESRLLPRPEGISVQERKRKRSAILRWIMKRMTPQHTATNSNLFVVQWRWSVHRQPETMTPWQTVMVRNKMYAILKHLLAPGRFYLFRVAAVNAHGTYGFSQPSHPPFKLSQEVRAPSAPANLSSELGGLEDGSWMARIGWSPPQSELPLKEYRLSWGEATEEMAQAFELRQRRHSAGDGKGPLDEDYEQQQQGPNELDLAQAGQEQRRTSTRTRVLPSYSSRAELDGLQRGRLYLVELYATVESSEGELRGEPAVIFVRAKDVPDGIKENENSSSKRPASSRNAATTKSTEARMTGDQRATFAPPIAHPAGGPDDSGAEDSHLLAELKTPFFDAGRLKTILSWLDHPSCGRIGNPPGELPRFRVQIRSLRCVSQMPPQEWMVSSCVASLENLQFRCEYFVSVHSQERATSDPAKPPVVRMTFSTLPCEQTPADVPLRCEGAKAGGTQRQAKTEEEPVDSASQLMPIGTTPATKTRSTKWEGAFGEEVEWLPVEQLAQTEEFDGGTGSRRPTENTNSRRKEVPSQQLQCLATSKSTGECGWTWTTTQAGNNNPLIGFRTVLASTMTGLPSNVTIFGPDQRRVHLTGLSPKAVYRFRLQAVTAHGLGAELVEHFNTAHMNSDSPNEKGKEEQWPSIGDLTVDERADLFPNSVELPLWGSSSSLKGAVLPSLICWLCPLLCKIHLILWRLF